MTDSLQQLSFYVPQNPIASPGGKVPPPKQPDAPQALRSSPPRQHGARPAGGMRPRSRSQEHPSRSLPARPPPPCGARDGLFVNAMCFPFQVTGKKRTSPAREVGGAGGWGERPESSGLKPYLQWISHAKRWFSKLLSPQHI